MWIDRKIYSYKRNETKFLGEFIIWPFWKIHDDFKSEYLKKCYHFKEYQYIQVTVL